MSDNGPPAAPKSAAIPAWMATFADMMALMMTFFVLLFASSSVEKHKFEQIAGSMAEAFGGVQFIKSNSTDMTRGMEAGIVSQRGSTPIPFDDNEPRVPNQIIQTHAGQKADESELLLEQLKALLAEEIAQQSIVLERDGDDVVIRFPEHVSFSSGSANLVDNAAPMIDRIVGVVRSDQTIIVAGHTDNRPLRGGEYHSNWELSAARAASVADTVLRSGKIVPRQLMVAGYADTRPIENNDTPENRARNRRVEIILKSSDAPSAATTLPLP